MIKAKFFSVLFVLLMVFASVGSASATAISNDVKDSHVIVVDNPTVNKIQNAVNSANNFDTILINGSASDTGNINCNKILNIKGENCTLNNIHWECNSHIDFENITFENCKSENGGAIKSEDSVKITNCNFIRNSANTKGGAIWAINDVDVDGCSFKSNYANGASASQCDGGAIYSDKGSVICIGSSFVDNIAGDYGGAIWSSVNVDISNCSFEENGARDNEGGAIYADKCSVDAQDSSFVDNFASDDGGAIWANKAVDVKCCSFKSNCACGAIVSQCEGGAIYSDEDGVKIIGSNFTNNFASDYGGAVWSDDGVTVENCLFRDNSVTDNCGGAIYSNDDVHVSDSSFIGSHAKSEGGAIWADNNVTVDRCSFVNNSASGASVSQCEGGAIYSDSDGVNLNNSNFTNNFAYDYGGAVWSDDGVTVENCLFRDNSVTDNRGGAIYMDDSCDLKVSHSAFYNNHANEKGGAIYCEGNKAHIYLDSFNSFENNTAKEGSVVFTDGYFDSIKNNWWGSVDPDWDSGLLVEGKFWPWSSNIKHHDDSPLNYDPNL